MAELSYGERNPPYAAVGFARLLGIELKHVVDSTVNVKATPTLKFASG